MPKLYYSETSCGASNFISAYIAGVQLDVEQVDIFTKITNSGADYRTINPKGNVPGLVLENGELLNENLATLLYIADQKPDTVAPSGGLERYQVINALSYIASEVHHSVSGFVYPSKTEDELNAKKERYNKKLSYLETTLVGDKQFLVGNKFSVADAYLFIVLSWVGMYFQGVIDLVAFPKLQAYVDRIGALESVKAARARIATNPTTVL